MTWILIKSGLPCPTSFLATQEILASVSKVTGSMVQLNVLTSWTIWPPLFQIYSVASGRPGSSTLQVNVMAWPLTTISVSLLIKACPGGSARPKIHIMRVDFMTVNAVGYKESSQMTLVVDIYTSAYKIRIGNKCVFLRNNTFVSI